MRILCYCLMQQTVQAVVIPPTVDSLAGFLTRAQTAFALRSTLCAPIAPAQIWTAIRYVECKPVREGWVLRAEDYSWSSAAAHLWSVDMRRILDMEWWWQESRGLDWHSYLDSFREDEEELQISCDSGVRALPATA